VPGTPDPVGVGPNGLPPFWNATIAAIKGTQQAVNGLASGAPAGWVVDQWGNVTELSGANLAGSKMDGADLTGAKMSITSFLGTDLTKVKGLTQKQLDVACGDAATKLPPRLKVHTCR